MSNGRHSGRMRTPFCSMENKAQSLMGLVREANLQGTRNGNTDYRGPLHPLRRSNVFTGTEIKTHGAHGG